MDDPIKMPYAKVTDVEQAIYNFVDEHPEYDLTHYRDILERNGLEWCSLVMSELVMSEADVSELNGEAVMALLLRAVRAEHFCDAALLGFFEGGSLKRRILRLHEIEEQDRDEW